MKPLGQWPNEPEGMPRRLLMIADGGNAAPKKISLTTSAKHASMSELPTVEMQLFERSPHVEYVWERHLLRIRRGNRSVGLAMGLRTGGEVHVAGFMPSHEQMVERMADCPLCGGST